MNQILTVDNMFVHTHNTGYPLGHDLKNNYGKGSMCAACNGHAEKCLKPDTLKMHTGRSLTAEVWKVYKSETYKTHAETCLNSGSSEILLECRIRQTAHQCSDGGIIVANGCLPCCSSDVSHQRSPLTAT